MLRWFAPITVLLAASCAAYLNAGHSELTFDDLASNVLRDAGSTGVVGSVRRLFAEPWSADEQFAKITFTLNCTLNRALDRDPLDGTLFLAVNVLLHAVNGCLVYLLVHRLIVMTRPSSPPPIILPLAAALLFAVHPLQAGSVAYIVQRRGILASLFYLLGLLAYLRFREAGRARPVARRAKDRRREEPGLAAGLRTRQGLLWLVAIAVCYWLAIKSKSMAVTLPLALLTVESCLRAADPLVLRRYSSSLLVLVALCGLGGLAFLWSQGLYDPARFRILPHGPAQLHGPWAQLLTESRVFVHYWKLLILPLPNWMCVDHQFDVSRRLTDQFAFVAVALHGLVLASAWFAAKRGRTLAALGVFWFYVALLPYAVIPQTELFVEYKTYLPSVALAFLFAEAGLSWRNRLPILPGIVCAIILVTALMTATLRRNAVYCDPVSFYSDAVAKYPRHVRPRNNLADTLIKRGKFSEAAEQLRAGLEIAPNNVDARYNLGNMLGNVGRYEEAIREYEAARDAAPGQIRTYIMWANALSRLERFTDIEPLLRTGLQASAPDEKPTELAKAHFNLGNELARQGRFEEAVTEYETAVFLDANHANAYYGMGVSLMRQGRTNDAAQAYSKALAINPNHPQAREALSVMLNKLDRAEGSPDKKE
jgi:tetratricopeptide (TPR) repeat protein